MALNRQTQDVLNTNYEALLLSYAAGSLDEAQNLIVASHLTYSATARNLVHQCESIGGSLIETSCDPVSLSEGALDAVLGRLDENFVDDQACADCALDLSFQMPQPIKTSLADKVEAIQWRTLFPGMKSYDLDLTCQQSIARFMKADPGTKSPHHSHGGTEITLVLDGAFEDETGQYKVGDLIVTDEDMDHTPLACEMRGCTCLVVSTAPIKLKGRCKPPQPIPKNLRFFRTHFAAKRCW